MTRARRLAAIAALVALGTVAQVSAQVKDWPSERPPRPLAARDVKFPPYQFRTLSNGLQVIAVSHHEQPAVSLRLIVRAGGTQDPDDKPGVASLAAALLDQGTTTREAEQIASSIDSIGGAIGTGAGSDLTFINAVVMKDSLAFALDLVSDVARNPRFAPEEIDRQKQQMLSGLKVSYEDPDYIAAVVFDRLVYGFHPYGRPDSGTPKSIYSITRDDLVAFHKGYFSANNAILAIVGDVTADEAFAGAERAFGMWAKSDNIPQKRIDPPAPTRRVVVIDRPGAVQTEVRIGNIGLPRKHQDFLALDLAIKILGGEGGNRLHRVLRSERGLTYGASADVNALKDSGDIVADTDTRSESTGEVVRLIVDEMWRLQRQRVSDRELADAQAYLTGSFPLTIETPSAIALQVLNAVFYGLDLNELQNYRERVNAVTPDDIQRVAREYLHPDRLSIVLVGDASVFAKQLAGVGFEEFERIPLSELDLGYAQLRRTATPAGRLQPIAFQTPSAQAPAAPSVRDMIDRAVRAKGGLTKLRGVRTVRATTSTSLTNEAGRFDIPTSTWIRYPDAYRVEATMPAGTVTQLFVAGQFWIKSPKGWEEAPAAASADIKANIQRDSIPLLIALAEGKVQAKATTSTVDGKEFPALEIALPGLGPLTVALDPKTSLISYMRYALPDKTSAEEAFTDYRNINGLQVAFNAEVRRPGLAPVVRIVKTFEYNVDLDPALFTKPS
jgi:zinc protease